MDTLSYKTVSANAKTTDKQWVVVDLENEVLGRACSKIAKMLRGKHKANYTPHIDCGDNVIVVNAGKVRLTGNKWNDRKYIHYTGYPGGQRETTASELLEKSPEKLVQNAVKGMLPKNRLGRAIYGNLHVYVGPEHDHEAQKPKTINIKEFK